MTAVVATAKASKKRIRAVHTDADVERQGGGMFNKWDYNMRHYDAGVRNTINDVISYVENELGRPREISERDATCTFYAGRIRFAIIYAYKTKDYGNFEFLVRPGTRLSRRPRRPVSLQLWGRQPGGQDCSRKHRPYNRVREACARRGQDGGSQRRHRKSMTTYAPSHSKIPGRLCDKLPHHHGILWPTHVNQSQSPHKLFRTITDGAA